MHQKILLDQHFKNILRSKLVLAYIMKDNLDEYANSSIGEIMKCIEPKGDVPLHTHLISGHRNENNEDDVSVVFDSLIYASLPHDDKRKIAMIINLEAQGELKGRSHVLSRANYYNSRNVSMQVEEVFNHAQYDDIVKVVSIWIVFNAPKHKQNCINRYRMVEEHIIGNACEEEKYFDKQQIIVLYLGCKENEKVSMNILRILADQGMNYETKNQALKKYNFRLKGGLAKEVRSMCDYGAYVEEMCMKKGMKKGMKEGRKEGIKEGIKEGRKEGRKEGIKEGIKEGMKEGMERGRQEGFYTSLCSLMENMKINLHDAMKLLNIPESEYDKYMELMNHS